MQILYKGMFTLKLFSELLISLVFVLLIIYATELAIQFSGGNYMGKSLNEIEKDHYK